MKNSNNINLSFNENGCTVKFNLPERHETCSEEELNRRKTAIRSRLHDLLGSFAPRMIEALQARMSACRQKLLAHIGEAWTPCVGIICWQRSDGVTDHFSQSSYETMGRAIMNLSAGNFAGFFENVLEVDQTLKALLNMPELDHSDCGGFRFSELVSALMEALTPYAVAARREDL